MLAIPDVLDHQLVLLTQHVADRSTAFWDIPHGVWLLGHIAWELLQVIDLGNDAHDYCYDAS